MGMMINRRRVCGGKSLPYDAEIEYLESTGTQWIDTGIKPKTNTVVDVKFILASTTNQQAIYGSGEYIAGVSEGRGMFLGTSADGTVYCNHTRNPTIPSITLAIKTEYTCTQQSSSLTINSRNYSTEVVRATSSSMLLFARRLDNQVNRIANAKVYYMKIYDATLIQDLIPVRVGNVGYMYDKVSGQLFGNNGTGSFILGPDV